MTTAGQINVKLGLNSDEFIKAWSNADDKIKALEKSLENSKKDFENVSLAMAGTKNPSKELVGLFEELRTKLQADQSALNDFQGRLKGFQGDLVGGANPAVEMLTGALKKLAAPAAIALVGKKLVDLGKQAVDTAAKFESLAVSFEVLTGGAEAGQRLTNQIVELASKTPLTTEALTSGARTLLSFGESAEEVVNDLKLLGDITGGDVQRMQSLTLAFAQVGSTGRLAGQDLLQMVNAGFNPLETMAQKTNKSMAQLKKEMSEGKITFNDVKQAMIEATSEGGRFYGMMDKQSQTLEGRLSTLADTWSLVSKNIGDFFLPAAKAAVGALNKLGESVLALQQKLRQVTLDMARQSSSSQLMAAEGYKKQAERLYQVADDYEKRGNKAWAESYRKKAAEFEAYSKKMLATYEETLKKEQDLETQKQTGFSAISSTSLSNEDSPAVKAAKKQKEDLLAISKSYAQEMANIESYNTAKSELMADGGRFQRNYEEKLRILQWYHNERYKITQAANGNIDAAQEQFNQLEELKNRKWQEANITSWSDWGKTVKGVVGSSLNTLLTTTDNFGDAMMNIMNMIYRSLIKMALDKAMEEIKIAQMEAAIKLALNALTGGIGGAVTGLISKFPKFHSGGVVPGTKEQIAVLKGGERVLSPAENNAYSSGQDGISPNGINNIMIYNIKAWDGKDVINTFKQNSQTINQIVASGIKNNNQGLRTIVQNT